MRIAESLIADLRAQDAFLKPKQVRELLDVHRQTLYKWVRAGKIPAHYVGRDLRFDPKKLAAWLAARETGYATNANA
jgi:excisionase family DNA binding protein